MVKTFFCNSCSYAPLAQGVPFHEKNKSTQVSHLTKMSVGLKALVNENYGKLEIFKLISGMG